MHIADVKYLFKIPDVYFTAQFLVEFKKREKVFKNKDLRRMYNKLSAINQQFIAILFGSYTNNMQTKNSDIDLCIISENIKFIKESLSLLPLNIHLIDLNNKEFLDSLKTKEETVISEIIKKI